MITIPSILESVATRKDGSVKLTFGTSELAPQIMTELFRGVNNFVYLAIKDEDFKPNEIEKLSQLKVDYDDRTKTPSQRLRGVFYKLYEQDSEGFKSFSSYYEHRMEKVIEHFKTKIL
jgi:glycine betaine/choline ABC-type transport system substrate-binding protein